MTIRSLFVGSLFLPLATFAQVPGLPTIDFQRYFPHIVAISAETQDKDFPRGVQYKFLTVRDEQENVVVVALMRREGGERLVRVFLAKGPVEDSESTLRGAVKKFSEKIQIPFEIVDLREIKSATEFQVRAESLGWGFQALPK